MIMPFGKHRGKRLEECPLAYLAWVLRECTNASPYLRTEISRILAAEARRQEVLGDSQSSTWLTFPALADRWYRQLAREFHPDKGGSHEGMKAVNRGRELLLQLVKEAVA